MNMRKYLLVLIVFTLLASASNAQEKKPIDPHEKRFTLEFKNATWKEVFEKLADQTDMPYASPYPAPAGKFTYSSPKGKKLSLFETIDAINEQLTTQNHVLIARDVTLTMFPLDADMPDFKLWRRAEWKDYHLFPRHVPVRTVYTFVDREVEDVAKQIDKFLGPFGNTIPLPQTNQLIITASPDVLRTVRQYFLLQDNLRFKFDFASKMKEDGATHVSPTDEFTLQRMHGFDLETKPIAADRGVTDQKPFYFSVILPEGSYNVTMTFGDPKDVTDTTVLAESRRFMTPRIVTAPGKFETRVITVNIRNAQLKNGRVKLKDREINGPVSSPALHWDDKLTLEFAGKRPSLNTLEIVRNETATTVFLAGDSTVTDQTKGDYRGWGQMLPSFFHPGMVAIANHAESGEATTSFIGAKRLDKILQLMKKGDYLFIQFGHNDQNQKRSIEDYTKALKRYVDEARKRSATPVVVTPIARRNFGPDGKIRNNLGEYPDAVRQLAKDENVAMIDLNLMSKEYYESLGPDKSKAAFVAKDNTHTNEAGAMELARRVAQAIRKSELGLAKHLVDDR